MEELNQLKQIIQNKSVVVFGSVPPKWYHDAGLTHDIVVRCNEWWGYDEGRIDIWFSVGASNKFKMAWFFGQDRFREQLKLACAYSDGAEFKKINTICGCCRIPIMPYNHKSLWEQPIRGWFANRGTSPSTGLLASWACSQCEPKELLITGMDLYAKEPDYVGWTKHNPIGHCYWYRKLEKLPFVTLGEDLLKGINFWESQDESCNS